MDGPRFALALAIVALAAGGCAPSLDLAEAPPVASTDWSVIGGDQAAGAAPSAKLATLLASPELTVLTERALARNSDLRIAASQVAQAEAILKGARLASLPEVTLSAGATRERTLSSALPDLRELFASLDASIDLDVFNRLGAAKDAAKARVEAAGLSRDAVALAVETDVALAYVQRAALQRRIAIIDQNVERAVELERVIRVRFEEGDANRVDLGLQSIHLLNLRAERADVAEALDQTRTALALLTGDEAPLVQFAPGQIEDLAIPELRPAAPAVLLAARPDIRAAEALIAAAEGDVREARANFFPKLGINIGGTVTDPISGPLSKVVTIGSSLLAPIFSRGRLESDFALASAMQVETVERYRKAILEALAEVENANSAIVHSAEKARLLEQIVAEAQQTARLANLQYIEGQEDIQSMLDAQQFLADAEESQVLAVQARLLARIALYRAMGGHHGSPLTAANPRIAY